MGALAGADGRYRLANVPAGSYTVKVTSIGFGTGTQSVRVGANEQVTADFTLQVSAIPLEELVVTSASGVERLRSIGNSVAKVNAVEAVELGAPPTITGILNARAPGLVVNFATGRIGAGQSINIRGRSSLGATRR
jgi:iron complex outermembrane receptor protein